MTRRLLVGGAAVLAVVMVYAAAGYWLAPRLLRHALEERAGALGLALTVREVRTDPFALTVHLGGVELRRAGGDRLASAQEIGVDVTWASLWREGWILQQVSVSAPYGELTLDPQGRLNWPLGNADAKSEGRFAALRVQSLSIADGTLKILDRSRAAPAELILERLALQVRNLATREGDAQYRFEARLAEGGTLASDGTFSLAPRAAHGEVNLAGISLAQAWRFAAPGSEVGRGELAGHAVFAYEKERLVLHDVYAEAAGAAYSGVEASQVTLEAPNLVLPPRRPVELSVHARLKPYGSLAARGSVSPSPPSAHLGIEAASIPLGLVQRFLPETVAVDIAAGSLSGKGSLELAKGRAVYDGSAEIADLKLEERDSRRLLLGWKLARTEALKFAAEPAAIDIGELAVQAPRGRLAIEADGSVNFGELFKGRGANRSGPLHASVRRLRLDNGTLDFADRSLETPFEVTMRELSGTVTGFSTEPGDPALVEVAGRVGEYGSVRIRGTLDLDQPKQRAAIRAGFRNVGLAQLTPYAVKFAGYRVRSGRASADLRYRVRDGQLSGQNELVFQELQLGEKVERAGAPDLPLDLAVALLADPSGRITLDIPVRGNLNDPKFDFGGLVARALGDAIGKIVSAPFRALASVFGDRNDRDLSEVSFAAGSAALAPPEEESVARMAQALAQRPRLGVTVRGGFDPERDTAALKREAARNEIARRAGFESPGPLDFTDPKTLRAAESLYLERIGDRGKLQALRASQPRYGRALLERLAFILPADAVSAEKLARERAQSVRAALVEHGVDAQRVGLAVPVAEEAAEAGVPTQLALSANPAVEHP